MKAKRIFTSKDSFTVRFIAFLEDRRALEDFLLRTEFVSIVSYCSYFYDRVLDGDFKFRDAISAGFEWNRDEFCRWHLLARDWIKFIHSK